MGAPTSPAPATTDTAADGPPPSHPPRPAGALALGSLLVAVGTLWLLATLDVQIPVRLVGPALLVLVGVGLISSAVRGEPDGGPVGLLGFLGVILAIVALASTSSGVPLAGGVGDRVHEPADVEQIEDAYRLLAGTLTVDLREISFPEGTTLVEVSTVLGEVHLLAPGGVAVHVDGHVVAGTTDVLGHVSEGVAVSADRQSSDWDTNARRLEVRGRVALGQLHVLQVDE